MYLLHLLRLRSFEASLIFKLTAVLILLHASIGENIFAQAFNGYTLYSPNNTKYTYLINMNNAVVKSWTHTKTGGYSCYLLEDGSLMRSAVSSSSSLNGGGATGIVQRVAWDGTLLWEYTYSTSSYRSHHDIEPMPNGNVLLIAWEVKTAAQCVAAGLNHSASLWPDHIIEVQPVGTTGGNIVWQWHAWDHLIQDYDASKSNYGVVANHPELLDINVGSTSGDWMHINGISYNPTLDQIVISSHNLDEFYVIDHSTTTQEAASHSGGNAGKGGDILYRWGCPSNYDAPGSQVFNVVHNANWIPAGLPGAGNIMAFNNREGQGTSIVMEIAPPMSGTYNYQWTQGTAYAPVAADWSYTASGFYSNHLGGCQRLPNGNTLIAQSTSGKMFEVTSTGTVVWSYTPGGEIVRALRYAPDYAGLIGVPVELTSFTASIVDGTVNLKWTTATETNNSGFEIERSIDKNIFEKIGFVSGAGTSTEIHNYYFVDNSVSTGKYYYRIKQIDFDGTYQYSDLTEVDFNAPLSFTLNQNYPNPFNPSTIIEFSLPLSGYVEIKVYDILGKEVATIFSDYKDAGKHSIVFDASSLSSGNYIYRLTTGNLSQSKQMMLLK